MGVSARLGAAFLTLLAAAVAALAGAGVAGAATDPPPERLVADAEERVLRLHDLPPGYLVGEESDCEVLSPDDSTRALARFLTANRTALCAYEYERLFAVPGIEPSPPLVVAQVLALRDEAAAARLLALALEEIEEEGDDRPREIAPPAIGRETRFFRSVDLVDGKFRPASTLIWHEGRFVATMTGAGLAAVANDAAAVRLAARQQERILAPTPYTEVERADTEVALDNPALRLTVYWVGPEFRPSNGLRATPLLHSASFPRPGEGLPGVKARLAYRGLNLDLFTPRSWKLFTRSALGPPNRRDRCTKTRRVELDDGGFGLVFAGYGTVSRTCPKGPPDRFFALARVGGTVVGVNLARCRQCREAGRGPYNSLKGMKAVLRALTLRPKPVF